VLVQVLVTSGKNKGALYDAAGGTLGGREGESVTFGLAVTHNSPYSSPRKKKLENRNWKIETGKSKLENGNWPCLLAPGIPLETRNPTAGAGHHKSVRLH
jgi:hypothetical protein